MRDFGGEGKGMHETHTAPWMTAADSRRGGKTALSSVVCDRARRRYQVCLRLGFGGPVAACCCPPCSHIERTMTTVFAFPLVVGGPASRQKHALKDAAGTPSLLFRL